MTISIQRWIDQKPLKIRMWFFLLVFCAACLTMPGVKPISPAVSRQAVQIPLIFAPVSDQSETFTSVGLQEGAVFSPSGVALSIPGSGKTFIRFLGVSPDLSLTPENKEVGIINRITGRDSTLWKTHIPTFGAIKYQNLYDGIDLSYQGHEGSLKGTFQITGAADPGLIRWVYDGAQKVEIDPTSGDLKVTLPEGASLVEKAPTAWQEWNGALRPVEVHYKLDAEGIGFALGGYDKKLPLVIDPTLVYGTFAGGSSGDYGRGITVDGQGNAYVVGDTISTDFLGYNGTVNGSNEVLLLKFSPDGSGLAYGVILGGSSMDKGMAVAVNSAGEAYITVDAGSSDFPILNALFPSQNASNEGALLKFSASGDLIFSTWLPFNVITTYAGRSVAVDSQGNVIVTGELYTAIHTARDLAVLKINSPGTQVLFDKRWTDDSVYETPTAVAIGPNNTIYLTGTVSDRFGMFPVTANAVQKLCGRKIALGAGLDCDDDAFVVALDSTGSPTYISYLGGLGSDAGTGIAVGADGSVVVTGNTFSADFPTTGGSLMPACKLDSITSACYYDAFVTRIKPGGSSLDWSTYLNSDDSNVMDFAKDVMMDANGNVYITGYTAGSHFPIKDPIQSSLALGNCSGTFTRFCFDTTISAFNANGALVFSTYLGGTGDEYAGGLALDPQAGIYVTGYSYSGNFPTTAGALQPGPNLGAEFYVAKISPIISGPVKSCTQSLSAVYYSLAEYQENQ